MNGKFTDFARNEIYAFIRLTAILTTFIVTASFSILTLSSNSGKPFNGPWHALIFCITVIVAISNIIIVWGFLKWTLFKYYNKLDKWWKLTNEEKDKCEDIKKNAGKWRKAIWWTFFGSLILFVGFLVTSIL